MVSICFVRILMPRLRAHLYTDAGIVDSCLFTTDASTYAALVADVTEKLGPKWSLQNNFDVYQCPIGHLDTSSEYVQLQTDVDVTTRTPDDHIIIYPYNTETQVEIPDNSRPSADAGDDLEIHISGIPPDRTRTDVRNYLQGRFGPIKKLFVPEREDSSRRFIYANVTFVKPADAQKLLEQGTSIVYGFTWTYRVATGRSGSDPDRRQNARSRSRSRERSDKGGKNQYDKDGYKGKENDGRNSMNNPGKGKPEEKSRGEPRGALEMFRY